MSKLLLAKLVWLRTYLVHSIEALELVRLASFELAQCQLMEAVAERRYLDNQVKDSPQLAGDFLSRTKGSNPSKAFARKLLQ